MRKTCFIVAIAVAISAVSQCVFFTERSEAREKYVLKLPVIEGFATDKLMTMFQDMAKVISQKIDADITVDKLTFRHGDRMVAVRDLETGAADFAYLNGMEFAEYQKSGKKDLMMLFTLSMNKSTILNQCLYVRKGEIMTVEALRGKKWGASQLLPTRFLLYKKGINEPLEKFFSSVRFVSDAPIPNIVGALDAKDIDVFSAAESAVRLSGELNKKSATFAPLYCEPFESTWVFVARSGVPSPVALKLRDIMTTAHRNPEFNGFKFAFAMIDGNFTALDERAKKLNETTYELVRKNGWLKEEDAFIKKHMPRAK
ncbi:MAG: ABC transporter, phosphonate, periplasmic substrate-binding protein [bacterium ADurb.Bin236]|nr:MAG: ABC transporter, phosphonate, periplasmic substrate-binding protein [bacterium ADurb.Bin236]HOY64298.1 PhnD/SsuA/transferrin family substrate-binding protein [bacterium]HPN93780.1 PhnD/SsuA/transferrin family substrate-binding protein [bacterium]